MEKPNLYQQYETAVQNLPDTAFMKATALRFLADWKNDQGDADFDRLYADAMDDIGVKIQPNSK
jgi:hypothetical protein